SPEHLTDSSNATPHLPCVSLTASRYRLASSAALYWHSRSPRRTAAPEATTPAAVAPSRPACVWSTTQTRSFVAGPEEPRLAARLEGGLGGRNEVHRGLLAASRDEDGLGVGGEGRLAGACPAALEPRGEG